MFSPFDVALGAGVPAPASLQVFAASVPAELRAAREFEWLTHADAAPSTRDRTPGTACAICHGALAAAPCGGADLRRERLSPGQRRGQADRDGRGRARGGQPEPQRGARAVRGGTRALARRRRGARPPARRLARPLRMDLAPTRARADRARGRITALAELLPVTGRTRKRWPRRSARACSACPSIASLVSPDGRLEAADEAAPIAPPDARLRDPDWRLAAHCVLERALPARWLGARKHHSQ
jgi:hypothetical protein